MAQQEQLARWRLILGTETQESFSGMGGGALSQEELLMDAALGAIYGGPEEAFGDSGKGAGKGPSSPLLSKWLGDLRSLFDPDTVAVVQSSRALSSFSWSLSCWTAWSLTGIWPPPC